MERKALKKHAKGVLKRNYLLLVAACLIAAVLGVEFTGSLSLVTTGALGRAADDVEESGIVNTVGGTTGGDADLYSVLLDLFGQAAEGSDRTEQPDGILGEVFGTSRGASSSTTPITWCPTSPRRTPPSSRWRPSACPGG